MTQSLFCWVWTILPLISTHRSRLAELLAQARQEVERRVFGLGHDLHEHLIRVVAPAEVRLPHLAERPVDMGVQRMREEAREQRDFDILADWIEND